MVDHRQDDRATHTALVFSDEQFDDQGDYIGSDPIGEVDVSYQSGGEGWVQADTGQRIHRDPRLDWPVTDEALAVEGRELHLRPIDEDAPDNPEGEYVIEVTDPTYGRYRELEHLAVQISSV